MALQRTDTSARRLNAVASADFSIPVWVCCWINPTSLEDPEILYTNLNLSTAGFTLRVSPATHIGIVWSSGGVGQTANGAHNLANGQWGWMHGGIDAAGNWVLGDGTNEYSGAGAVPDAGTSGKPALLANLTGMNTRAFEGVIADFRVYSRIPSSAEREEIRYGEGADSVVDGLVSRLELWDSPPGTDTGDQVPLDSADPSRVWSMTSAGTEYDWVEAPYPRRPRYR